MPTAFEKLAAAADRLEGLTLTPAEVGDLLEDFCELELQRELEAVLANRIIEELSGHKPAPLN